MLGQSSASRISGHGGPDALGVPVHDFSSNANACGPCPLAWDALQQADARHYPDPAYAELTIQLAAWHDVTPERIVLAVSGSEFIQRISVAVALQGGCTAWSPRHAYEDYAHSAQAAGLSRTGNPTDADLVWACDPSSPLGQSQHGLAVLVSALADTQTLVLDQAYAPLRLEGFGALDSAALDEIWRIVTPNKAMGLTGVRAAYAIAPRSKDQALLARVRALAPSWPLGAHGVVLLQCWAGEGVQAWVEDSRAILRLWKTQQIERLVDLGWRVEPSNTNFFVATRDELMDPSGPENLRILVCHLRQRGIKLRDCESFGLPGRVRMAVAAPAAQEALVSALFEWARLGRL